MRQNAPSPAVNWMELDMFFGMILSTFIWILMIVVTLKLVS